MDEFPSFPCDFYMNDIQRGVEMKYLSVLIKPISSSCNMECRYCFYYDIANNRSIKNYGKMSYETMYTLVEKMLSIGETATITFAFQGGEPTLAGISFFEEFIVLVKKKRKKQTIFYTIQSNGLLIDEQWITLFKENQFLVGISLDGYKSIHNYFRKTKRYEETYKKVKESIFLLQENEIEFNILSVLTNQLAKDPKKLFSFYVRNKLTHIQLIPCIPALGKEEDSFSLKPKQFARFYQKLFDLWIVEYNKGNYISISLFDNILSLFYGQKVSQCGILGSCTIQFIVESNGYVYPCDFYVLDAYCCGNIHTHSFEEIAKSQVAKQFLIEDKRICDACMMCKFISICNKNCKRMNFSYYTKDYCGYKELLYYMEANLYKLRMK